MYNHRASPGCIALHSMLICTTLFSHSAMDTPTFLLMQMDKRFKTLLYNFLTMGKKVSFSSVSRQCLGGSSALMWNENDEMQNVLTVLGCSSETLNLKPPQAFAFMANPGVWNKERDKRKTPALILMCSVQRPERQEDHGAWGKCSRERWSQCANFTFLSCGQGDCIKTVALGKTQAVLTTSSCSLCLAKLSPYLGSQICPDLLI